MPQELKTKEPKTKIKTKVTTKIIIGVVIVALVAIGISSILFFFGIVPMSQIAELVVKQEQSKQLPTAEYKKELEELEAKPPEVRYEESKELEAKTPKTEYEYRVKPEVKAPTPKTKEVTPLKPLESSPSTIKTIPSTEIITPLPLPVDPELLIEPQIIHRGSNRVIIKWTVPEAYRDKSLKFKYGEKIENLNKEAKVYLDKADKKHYVVLRGLKGGELYTKNDEGYKEGRFKYYFVCQANGKSSNVAEFKTLNRFQTILYYYNVVFGENFDLEANAKPNADLRAGGPYFFYNPEGKEPLTLPGVKFTMLNDKAFQEFDRRLSETEKAKGIRYAIEILYQTIFDRIYDDDLTKTFDEEGVNYWKAQVERTDEKRIDLFGVKFALSTSPEYNKELKTILPATDVNANLAYQIVLKRGAEKSGLEYLKGKYTLAKDMRKELALSDEYTDRLSKIEKEQGRKKAISELYETLYARPADLAGVDWWDKTGLTLDEIKTKFLESEEFLKIAD